MLKKLIAINVALLLVAGLLAWQLYISSARFNAGNDPSKLQPAKDPKKQIVLEGGLPPLKPRRHYNPEEFGVIPAQNLFAETRSMQAELETPAAPPPPKLVVRPVLVGVTISGNKRLASVVEPTIPAGAPGTRGGGGRRAQTKRVGDVCQGWTIVDITENQMVLGAGEEREVIPLFDTTKQRTPAAKTPVVATRVVSLGGGGGSGGARGPAVYTAGAAPPGAPGAPAGAQVSPISSGPQATAARGSALAAARQAQGGAQQGQPPVQVNPAMTPAMGERINEQGQRVIRTPFGDIIRPERPPNDRPEKPPND